MTKINGKYTENRKRKTERRNSVTPIKKHIRRKRRMFRTNDSEQYGKEERKINRHSKGEHKREGRHLGKGKENKAGQERRG